MAGSLGVCTDVPSGQDPLGQCADNGAATCAGDGTCDGKGACRLSQSGTTCIPPTSSGTTATLAGRCDGAGKCTAGAPVVCGAADACHEAGVCNPATGACSEPAALESATSSALG